MSNIFFSLLFIAIINRTLAAENKWCSVDCHNNIPQSHVLCHYSPNVVSKSCGQIIQSGLTDDDKNQILNAHNSMRQKVASGQETRGNPGPQPPAQNMPNLEWDDQLAQIAQAWANQCQYEHSCSHLSSRYEDQVGQNLAISWGANTGSTTSYVSLVDSWYNEVDKFNANQVRNYLFSMDTGHYSQLMWAKTTKVGCGGMKYKNTDETVYLVCNYSPAGNYGGQAVYEIPS